MFLLWPILVSFCLLFLLFAGIMPFSATPLQAASTDNSVALTEAAPPQETTPPGIVPNAGQLSVTISSAYNLVVDSNVESPSTYAPSVATVNGRFCNIGDMPLTGVQGYIGDAGANTPGTYPARNSAVAPFTTQHPHLAGSGFYSFTHVGGRLGLRDARRYLGTLAPGECKVQYWHFTYPRRRNPNNSGAAVWGLTRDPNDDLWLTFDIWGTSQQGSSATATRRMTMRNEISAMANKIFPNGGTWFNTDTSTVRPGDVITSNGVRYELGVINKGFDNDGDYAFDYNAWLQPIGDPSYDPTCFRLIRTSGSFTVSISANPDLILPFVDNLYFTDIPEANNGAIGNVYYAFMALDGPCSTALTPYQEVASGADNEKFNGDYGVGVPALGSLAPQVVLSKTATSAVSVGGQINYILPFHNTSTTRSFGLPLSNMPLVISDTVPPNTTYVGGSAQFTLNFLPNTGVTRLYSTDYGLTWSPTEPVPASTVTTIQWWLNDPLPAGATGEARFSVTVGAAYGLPAAPPYVNNLGDASVGATTPFDTATAQTLVIGPNRIGDFVWRDLDSDGVQDGGAETGIANISVRLYWDQNGNGTLNTTDPLLVVTSTNASGFYFFPSLRNGNYLVQVDTADPDIPAGFRSTTQTILSVPNLGTTTASPYLLADFGFSPALRIDKALSSPLPPTLVYEADRITYTISLINTRPGNGTAIPSYCQYRVWAGVAHGDNTNTPPGGNGANAQWTSPGNTTGAPNGAYATTNMNNNSDILGLSGFVIGPQLGNITNIQAQLRVQEIVNLDDDQFLVRIWWNNVQQSETAYTAAGFFTGPVGTVYTITQNVPAAQVPYTWASFANTVANVAELQVVGDRLGGTSGDLALDAAAYIITTDQVCNDPTDTIVTLPLTDTFDTARLQFLSASPPETTVSGGTISWANLGPLYPGQVKPVTVSFLALEPPDDGPPPGGDADTESDPVTTMNRTGSTGSRFADGRPTNNASDEEPVTINPAGSIGDRIWNDNGRGGGTAANGIQDGTEQGIPYVTVELRDGVCTAGVNCRTTTTNANGDYLFSGLRDGSYTVVVLTASLPGTTFTQRGDPDVPGVNCDPDPPGGGNDNCDDQAIRTIDTDNGSTADDEILTVDFGYVIPNAVFGNVWQDHNGNSTRNSGDNGIAGVTVELRNNVGTLISTTTTDANGNYLFNNASNLPDGTYRVVVLTGSLPPGGTWANTSDPEADNNSQTNLISVSGGNVYGSYDFGYHRRGTLRIGDTLYRDWNGDGDQDPGEEGLPNITVRLYEDANGDGLIDPTIDALIATTSTLSSGTVGFYRFEDLPGVAVTGLRYLVVVDAADPDYPANHQQTQDGTVGLCAICDNRASVTLTTANVLTVDFGYRPIGFGSIGDYVWRDNDHDAVQDSNEPGLASILVELYEDENNNGVIDVGIDALVAVTTTRPTTAVSILGSYIFKGLPADDYLVRVDVNDTDLPVDGNNARFVLSTGSNPIDVTLAALQNYTTADFGFTAGGLIGDFLWQDNDLDGTPDVGEPGISNVTVRLYNDVNANGVFDGPDTLRATTDTLSSGFYQFGSLPAGRYVVVVDTTDTDLPSTTVTGDPDVSPDALPGCVTCNNQTGVNLSAGQIHRLADFGFAPVGIVGDTLWIDNDNDGVRDAGEAGLAYITVTLRNLLGTPVMTTTTDSDGYYSFGKVANGSYTVVVNPSLIPAGLVQTFDPDQDLAHPCTVCDNQGSVTLAPGNTTDLTLDFGYRLSGPFDINGTVFRDRDQDTNYEPFNGEGIYSGTLVYLWRGSLLLATTTTNAQGHYTFPDLPNGNYTVSINSASPQFTGATLTTPGTNAFRTPVTIAGADVFNQNFGFFAAESISDFVWRDLDVDGIQDLGEPGIPGVVVELYSSANVLIATDITDAAGLYEFSVTPGDYYVRFIPPTGYVFSPQDQGGDDTVDSDANPTTGQTIVTTISAGETDDRWDAGLYQPIAIGNFVWLDEDGNGRQDEGEPGIPNITVNLTYFGPNGVAGGGDDQSFSTVTDAAGGYLFRNLPPGNHRVDVDNATLPAGLVQTTLFGAGADYGNQADPYNLTVAMGVENLTADFGYNWNPSPDVTGNTGTGAIGDRVWIDTDGDGAQDPDELGVSGLSVQLLTAGPDGLFGTADDVVAASTTTNATGNYIFDGLAVGSYAVRIPTPPAGYTQTGDPDHYGTTGANDNRTTVPLVLGPGDVIVTVDFGYQPNVGTAGAIGDLVWLDANGNGTATQDAGEPGIPGVTVALIRDLNSNGVRDAGEPIVATDVTDASGQYLFGGVPPGAYLVLVTDTNNVLNTLVPSFDFNGTATPNISPVTAVAGTTVATQDFSYTPAGHSPTDGLIGDTIFFDVDANGTQGANEPGLEYVTVMLTHTLTGAGYVVTTDENGHYYVGNLPTGTYTVTVVPPAGFTNTADPDGGNNSRSLVTIGGAQPLVNLAQDFGYRGSGVLGTIGSAVWNDLDADGFFDGTETGIAGVTVELYQDSNNNGAVDPGERLMGTTTTNGAGTYSFTGLPTDDGGGDARYIVNVSDEAGRLTGWWHSLGTAGADNNSQSDPYSVTLTPGAPTNNTADFGYYQSPAAVGNFVWNDTNGNGLQDGGELGIAGLRVTMTITYPGGAVATVVTTTNASGFYTFGHLLDDENFDGVGAPEPVFVITVQTPGGFTPSPSNVGGNDTIDSDGSGVTATPLEGQTNITYDFGFTPLAAESIGDFVWLDLDGDGVQDIGEPGLPGVIVELYTSANVLVATDVTDAAGLYEFSVTPGDYYVRFIPPTGHVFTVQDSTLATDLTDSDANPTTGQTIVTTISAGETDDSWDAGLYYPTAIGNFVWLDEDGDGFQDEGEPGLPNITVNLTYFGPNRIAGDADDQTFSTVTDAAGGYLFRTLPPGDFEVDVDNASLPLGLVQTTTTLPGADYGNQTDPYTLLVVVMGMENLTADFGYNWNPSGDVTGNTGTVAIGDRVWIDTDGDGAQDADELGLSGLTVELLTAGPDGLFGTADDVVAASTTTNATGNYIFDTLPAGAYAVRIPTPPAGYTQTGDPDHYGTIGANDHRTTVPLVLAPGDVVVTVDFGYRPAAGSFGRIGDTIWLDANGNGAATQDAGEPGIPGVTVALIRDLNNNGVRDAGEPMVATDITDANGQYLFEGVPPGAYLVLVTDTNNVLNILVPTFDANGTGTPNISAVTAVAGVDTLTQDFSYTPANHSATDGIVGDRIWFDLDGDGVQDTGEPGIEAITVTVTNNTTGAIYTVVTDENGNYAVGNLPAGTYTVVVTPPTGFTNTGDPDGGNNSTSTVVVGGAQPLVRLDQDFGYRGTGLGSIGSLIWEDLDADGVFDVGEPPIPNVTLELYQDSNNNGEVDAGERLLGTATTDGTGTYSFTGLPTDDGGGDARYIVNVSDLNSVVAGWWHSQGAAGVDNNSQFDPYSVTLTPGTPTNNTADFGYYHSPAQIGNFVWSDTDGDGIQDGGEPGLPGITVTLTITFANGTVVTLNTLTDASGFYTFGHLLDDEDLDGAGAGEPTFRLTVATPTGYAASPSNVGGDDTIDSDGSGVLPVPIEGQTIPLFDFGFDPTPLAVMLANFEAIADPNEPSIRVVWETTFELDNQGFNIYRSTFPDGPGVRLNASLIPSQGPGSPSGYLYEWLDTSVTSGASYYYWLEDVDLSGVATRHGPVSATLTEIGCPDVTAPTGVDAQDIMVISAHWNQTPAHPDWNTAYDMDQDGDVDVVDIMRGAVAWGTTCP